MEIKINDFVFKTRWEAEEVLSNLLEILEDYREVSIEDLNNIIGYSSVLLDTKYGWKDLRSAMVFKNNNYYRICLPEPIKLKGSVEENLEQKMNKEIKKPILVKHYIKVCCSVCGKKFKGDEKPNYCPKCGNAINWHDQIDLLR